MAAIFPGVFATCSSNRSMNVLWRLNAAAVLLKSKSSCFFSLSVTNCKLAIFSLGASTIERSNSLKCSIMRRIVASPNRSVLYCTEPCRPFGLSCMKNVISNFAVESSNGTADNIVLPSFNSGADGAFCKSSIAWNNGLRLKSLSFTTVSTTFSKGTSW